MSRPVSRVPREATPAVRLSYLLQHDVVQAALQNFTARTGLPMHIITLDSHPVPPVPRPADLCALLQTFGRCALTNPGMPAPDGTPLIRFDAGPIGHLIIPIEEGARVVGFLVSAPFAVSAPDFPTFYEIAKALPAHPDSLMKAALEVPVVAEDTVRETADLLRAVLGHVAALTFRHHDQLSVLQAFDSVIANLSQEVLADLILNVSARLLQGHAGLLTLQNREGQRQEATTPGAGVQGQRPELLRLLREVGNWVLEARRPISIADLRASPWGQHILGDDGADGSVLATPLLQRERVRGALVLLRNTPTVDPEDDLQVLSVVAAQAANTLTMLERLIASEEQALTDSLTGLYNYRFFQQHLPRELSRASRGKKPLSLIVLDIDNFKTVNDSFGHDVGNRVLQHLARLLERTIRKANVVVRYGGEEFCIIVPDGDLETARAIAERVCSEIRNTPYGEGLQGPPIQISVSAGVTAYVPDGSETDNTLSLFKRADENLLIAKKEGKDRVFAR